jgi:glycosyltransferase involved in cell wall biosynthesis
MRIGIVTGEYPPMEGGVGAYTRILARTLARQGHEIFVFSSSQAREAHPRITLANPARRWGPGSLRALRRWARSVRLDVVSLQFETAAYGMSPWVHFLPEVLRGLPVVTTFHDLLFPYLFPKAGPLRDWIVMRLARASAGVIATNHEDLSRLAHLTHAKLIPIGSNISTPPPDFDRERWRMQAGVSDGDLLLVYFGFINRSKGMDTLLQALAQLRADHVSARMVIIGGRAGSSDPSNIAYANEIDTLIQRLELEPYIHRTGFVDDEAVSGYLLAGDVVALPFRDGASYRRGSLMAAIQHGCAIVTTRPTVDIPTFQHGKNMLFVLPDDVPALVDGLRLALEAYDLRATLRHGALELAGCFEWDLIAAQCAEFFHDVRSEYLTRQSGNQRP